MVDSDSFLYGEKAKFIVFILQASLGILANALIGVWCFVYRGGLAFRSSDKLRVANLHVVFTFTGFIFLTSEAILVYKIKSIRPAVQKGIHATALVIAMINGGIGIYAIFKSQRESGIRESLYTLHAWLGIAIIVLFVFQWVVGLWSFLYPGWSKSKRASFLPWHRILGVFLYVVVILTAVTGFTEKLFILEERGLYRLSSEAMLLNAIGLVIFLFGTFVVFSAILPP